MADVRIKFLGLCGLLAALAALSCPAALAGIGYADSEPALLDTRSPELELGPVSENLVVHAGQIVPFSWTSFDDNPGTGPDDFLATVTIAGVPDSSLSWFPLTDGYSWDWIAPEAQSAECRLEVTVRDLMGNSTSASSAYFTVLYSTTDAMPGAKRLQLGPAVPNPFNPACRLDFELPWTGRMTGAVHDVRGRRVRLLDTGIRQAGRHTLHWDGTDEKGRRQPGGLYLFVLDVDTPEGPRRLTRRAVLIP
jgi:hypothetical protein